MESENKEFKGFSDEDLDPLVFAESNDDPELRKAALSIPRPVRDEDFSGPKKSRVELILENEKDEASQEWVPAEENPSSQKKRSLLTKNLYEYVGKFVLFLIPIGLIFVFLSYSSSRL